MLDRNYFATQLNTVPLYWFYQNLFLSLTAGSTHTTIATVFALSVFSQLLHHSLQRLAHLLLSALRHPRGAQRDREKFSNVEELLGSRRNMVQILQGSKTNSDHGVTAAAPLEASPESAKQQPHPTEERSKDSPMEPATLNTRQQAGNIAATSLDKQRHSPKTESLEKPVANKQQKKKRSRRIVDRRRQRRRDEGQQSLSSEESTESSDDGDEEGGGAIPRSSSNDSLSTLSDHTEGEDLDLLGSLSDSSCTSEEEEEEEGSASQAKPPTSGSSTHLLPTPVSSTESTTSPRQKPRRNIVLAANFNSTSMQPELATSDVRSKIGAPIQKRGISKGVRRYSQQSKRTHDRNSSDNATKTSSGAPIPAATSGVDASLLHLLEETEFQSTVYGACGLSAEDSYLMAIKVFADWLQSHPVIIATCGQVRGKGWPWKDV